MKKRFIILPVLLGSIFLINACSKGKEDICDYNQICYTEEPDELYVKLELSTSPNNAADVTFYRGYYEEGDIIDEFSTIEGAIYYLMPVDQRYTATAKYEDNGEEITVIDSEKLSAISYENCETTCYDWEDEIVLDLKLVE